LSQNLFGDTLTKKALDFEKELVIAGLLVLLILSDLPDYGFFLTTLRLLVLGIIILVVCGLFVLVREIFGN